MKSLKHYLAEADKQYNYKVKIAALELSDEHMEVVERALSKYDLVKISNPKRTVFQSRPLDFQEGVSGEINIIEATTRLPLSGGVVRELLSRKLGMPLSHVQVRGENDPLEEYDEVDAMDLVKINVGQSDGEDALLNQDYEDDGIKSEDFYGSEYNEKLVKEELKKRDQQ